MTSILRAAPVLCLLPLQLLSQNSLLLVGPTNAVSAGTTVVIGVLQLNLTEAPARLSLPVTVPGRILAGPRAFPVTLRRVQADTLKEGEAELVPVHGFMRREYSVDLPSEVEGAVQLEVPQLGPATALLQVTRTPAETAPRKSGLARFMQEAQPNEPAFNAGQFFKDHISGHEPFYFLASTESPNAKFQVSFKYQLVTHGSKLAQAVPGLEGIHFGYTQTSLWDWNGPSAPFFDSSYRPELLYTWEKAIGGERTNWYRLDFTGGAQHESNGKGGTDSRSLNIAYLRTTLTLGKPDGLQLTLSPRVWVYVVDLDDNPDMADYRGYADLRAVVGWTRGVQLAAIGRLGDDGNRGSIQLDLTYPLFSLLSGSFSVYLHGQYFRGYGESLLLYNEKGSSWRVGFSFYR